MPTYDYICDSCGHEFEAFESIKAEPADGLSRVQRAQAPPQDRAGGRDPVQGVGLLPDRLSQRVVQEGRGGRQARRVVVQAVGIVIVATKAEVRPSPRPTGPSG